MAGHAALLKNRSDILAECHLFRAFSFAIFRRLRDEQHHQ
jgi:hypothetical protein